MPAKTRRRKKQIAKNRRVIRPHLTLQSPVQTPAQTTVQKKTSLPQFESDIAFFKKDFNRSMLLTVIILISIVSLYGLQEKGLIHIADLITISTQ